MSRLFSVVVFSIILGCHDEAAESDKSRLGVWLVVRFDRAGLVDFLSPNTELPAKISCAFQGTTAEVRAVMNDGTPKAEVLQRGRDGNESHQEFRLTQSKFVSEDESISIRVISADQASRSNVVQISGL